jgi:hypothetical protein
MEVDAFLILVLSIYAVRPCGIWVLVIGGARYGYALAAIAVPWLGGAVPARTWRKAVAVAQGVALTVATAQVLPAAAAESVLVVAALLLAWSFGSQGWWLARRRHVAVPVEQALEPAGH